MRVVFAPWVEATGDGEMGVEFEVWKEGVRAVEKALSKVSEEKA